MHKVELHANGAINIDQRCKILQLRGKRQPVVEKFLLRKNKA